MAKLITNSTPKADGFRMPGEFEEQKQIFMIWPERTDNWRAGAKPAQKTLSTCSCCDLRIRTCYNVRICRTI